MNTTTHLRVGHTVRHSLYGPGRLHRFELDVGHAFVTFDATPIAPRRVLLVDIEAAPQVVPIRTRPVLRVVRAGEMLS